MATWPVRGQQAPEYWDLQLKAYIDEQAGMPGPPGPAPTMTAGDATAVLGGPASVDVNDLGGGNYSVDMGIPVPLWSVVDTETLAPGTPATATLDDSDPFNLALVFGIPQGQKGDKGDRGVTPRGVWSAATAYAVDDLATYNGSTYRRLVAGTTPGTPAADGTNWAMFAQKGADGSGSGDVVGPASSVSGNLPVFGDSTGKDIEDSGVSPAALVRKEWDNGNPFATNGKVFRDVLNHKSNASVPNTSKLVIQTGIPFTNEEMLRIKVQSYAATYNEYPGFDLDIYAYLYSGGGGSVPYASWTNSGAYPITAVDLYKKTSDGTLALVITTSVPTWEYAHTVVPWVMTSYGIASASQMSGWTVSYTSDLTGLTLAANPTRYYPYDDGHYIRTAGATAQTIAGQFTVWDSDTGAESWHRPATFRNDVGQPGFRLLKNGTAAVQVLMNNAGAVEFKSDSGSAFAPVAAFLYAAQPPTAGDWAYYSLVPGEANPRWLMIANGQMSWGPGSSTYDTNLYRSGVGQLATDGQLLVASHIYARGVIDMQRATDTTAFGTTVAGDTQYRFQSNTSGYLQWGPGNAVPDTNLYRVGAATLQTDSFFRSQRATAASGAFGTLVVGDSVARLNILADGKHEWGPGNAAVDTNLYRWTAGVLRTDGGLAAGTGFQSNAMSSTLSYAYQTAVTGDTNTRWATFANGQMNWGPGNTAFDTALYRSGVGTLKTDTKMEVGSFRVGSSATAGYVLTADALGNATWQAAGGSGNWSKASGGGAEDWASAVFASGTLTLNCASANGWKYTPTANITTVSLANVPTATNKIHAWTLKIEMGTLFTISWPAGWKWMTAQPTLVANKTCDVSIETWDGGTTIYAAAQVQP